MTFDENINGPEESGGHSMDLPGLNSTPHRLFCTAVDVLGAGLDEGHFFFRSIELLHAEAHGPSGAVILLVWPDGDPAFPDRLVEFRNNLKMKSSVFFVVFTEQPDAFSALKPIAKGRTGLMVVDSLGNVARRGERNRALSKALKNLKPSQEPILGWAQRQREVLRETHKVQRGIQRFRSQLMGRRVVATTILMMVLGLAFLFQSLLGGASPPSLVRLGAGVLHDGPFAFHPGRILGSMLLHGNVIHIAVNALALYIAGGLVERLYGSSRLLLTLAVSGAAGALASHFSGSAPFSVGFSGALFGLFGVLGGLVMRNEEAELPRGVYRQFRRQVFATLVLNAGISFLPMIDAAAHFGGAAAGFLLVFSGSLKTLSASGRPTSLFKLCTSGIVAVMVATYAVFLVDSRPMVLWADPVIESSIDALELSVPVPSSLESSLELIDDDPAGFHLARFGKMGDAYSISAGRRPLVSDELDLGVNGILDDVVAALDRELDDDAYQIRHGPRAVSRKGREWVEVEFEASSVDVVVNHFVGILDGEVYHYRIERLEAVPAALRLRPSELWETFFTKP